MVIDPIAFMFVVSALVLCVLVLLGLLGRHLWFKKVDAAAMDTILTSLDAMASTRHQVIANALRRFYEQDETALNEQASALVGYELAMQRNVLEAFSARRLSGLAALPGWAEQMVSPYHAIIRRLSGDAGAGGRGATEHSEQIDALRMAIHSDIACLKDDIRDETKRLYERLAENEARLSALESATREDPAKAAEAAASPPAEVADDEVPAADAGGIVFDNDDQDVPEPDATAPVATVGAGETTPSAAVDEESRDDGAGEGQDDLAAAWAEALEEAGTDDVDIDAMLTDAPDSSAEVRQSA